MHSVGVIYAWDFYGISFRPLNLDVLHNTRICYVAFRPRPILSWPLFFQKKIRSCARSSHPSKPAQTTSHFLNIFHSFSSSAAFPICLISFNFDNAFAKSETPLGSFISRPLPVRWSRTKR